MKNLIILLMLNISILNAQDLTQVLRGQITDKESTIPLIGVNVVVVNSDPFLGTATDIDGYYKIPNVKIGRISLKISSLGYETMYLNDVLITSGKEKVLDLKMTESLTKIKDVVVTANKTRSRAKNEMATISSKSFSVDETQRYAASADDPARMVSTYAGVSNAGNDFQNDISIRGNSPKGILWRMEGIEIPNPNHFASDGGSGGSVSMINSNTMSTSDFYTGAFPAEFGNATSGVFDINLRTGNNETSEFSVKVGSLGLEASAEGPFSKKSKASYLVSYRYSTTALVGLIMPDLFNGFVPQYQDLTLKVKVPTKKLGTFTLFGLGGINGVNSEAKADSSLWKNNGDKYNNNSNNYTGFVGLKHNIILSNKTYLKTIALASLDNLQSDLSYLDVDDNYKEIDLRKTNFRNNSYRLSLLLNHKFNSKSTLRIGAIGSLSPFDYQRDVKRDSIHLTDTTRVWKNQFSSDGSSFFTQAFAQWKFRINEKFTLNTGAHFSHLAINNTWAIDPRASLEYKIQKGSSISLAVGLHSKPEHISTYLIKREKEDGTKYNPNKNLEFAKSAQIVLGYKQTVFKNVEIAVEPYFQYQFDVPVGNDKNSTFSMANASDMWDVLYNSDSLINKGTGVNYGIDLTIQKALSKQYYYMLTGSLYESKYKALDGKQFNTLYSATYSLNLLGGKEFKVGKKKRNIIGLNGKFILKGGKRFTPIDFDASKLAGETVRYMDRRFEGQTRPYYRIDFGFSYKVNSKNLTHSIVIEAQNVTNNKKNIYNSYYDAESNSIKENYQLGIFPFIGYKLEFKAKSKK